MFAAARLHSPLRFALIPFILAACVGRGDDDTAAPGDADGGTEDGGTEDGGTEDGGTEDGGTEDGGTEDGGTEDGGTEDGGTEDGGTEDGGTEDGGTEDGGTEDGGTEDGGTEDGGTDDGGTEDGGSDDADGDGFLAPEDCDDTDDSVFPGAPIVCGDGAVNDCEGTEDAELEACLLVATLAGTDDWGATGLRFRGGDLDGDGYADLASSEPMRAVDTANQGVISVHAGPLTGDLDESTASFVLAGDSVDGGNFGQEFLLEDVDGDGVLDLLAAAPGCNAADTYSGCVYLFMGPLDASTVLDDAVLLIQGNTELQLAGLTLATLGDWDGDGVQELLVRYQGRETDQGIAVFSGDSVGEVGLDEALARRTGVSLMYDVGFFSAGGEDLDGDGVGDLVLSARRYETAGSSSPRGWAYLHLGPVEGEASVDDADESVRLQGELDPALAVGGDLDGDGYGDLLVGDHLDDQGTVHVLLGPVESSITVTRGDVELTGGTWEDFVGATVAFAGDVDGDGTPDIIIGSGRAWASTGAISAPADPYPTGAWVFLDPVGGGDRSTDEADHVLRGADGHGLWVAGLGDTNGDGLDDVGVGELNWDSHPMVEAVHVYTPGGL